MPSLLSLARHLFSGPLLLPMLPFNSHSLKRLLQRLLPLRLLLPLLLDSLLARTCSRASRASSLVPSSSLRPAPARPLRPSPRLCFLANTRAMAFDALCVPRSAGPTTLLAPARPVRLRRNISPASQLTLSPAAIALWPHGRKLRLQQLRTPPLQRFPLFSFQ
jgi:hypothetical protein